MKWQGKNKSSRKTSTSLELKQASQELTARKGSFTE